MQPTLSRGFLHFAGSIMARDQHLRGIITGRTGAGLLNLQCISNLRGVRGPCEGINLVDQMPLRNFLADMTLLFWNIELHQTWVKK